MLEFLSSRILSQLKHPNIVTYHDSFFDEDDEYLYIVQVREWVQFSDGVLVFVHSCFGIYEFQFDWLLLYVDIYLHLSGKLTNHNM